MGNPQQVNVQFFGICTHLAPEVMPDPVDWYQRTVLVNAGDPAAAAPEHLRYVKPHRATLQLKRAAVDGELRATPWFPITYYDGDIVEWRLDGVSMSVGHARPSTEPRTPTPCIPSLSEHMHIHPQAGRRSYQEDPSLAACFFDFKPVIIEPRIFVDAVIAVAQVWSDEPSLIVRRFGSEESIVIRLSGAADVSLSNIPDDSNDDADVDFRLHYLALASFPDEAWYPEAKFTCAPGVQTANVPRKLSDLTTPGCSNSNYP